MFFNMPADLGTADKNKHRKPFIPVFVFCHKAADVSSGAIAHPLNGSMSAYFVFRLRLDDMSSFHSDTENGIMPNHFVVHDSFTLDWRRISFGVSI